MEAQMILAEKITVLRKRNGWSQEDLAEKLGVSRQSISKWESAQSTPDLNRILAMSALFDVSTDTLLKDEEELQELPALTGGAELNAEVTTPAKEIPEPLRSVSMEEANRYLQLKAVASGRIAIGVMHRRHALHPFACPSDPFIGSPGNEEDFSQRSTGSWDRCSGTYDNGRYSGRYLYLLWYADEAL